MVTPKGIRDALRRSSGYQIPFRFWRQEMTVRSDMRPTKPAPTEEVANGEVVCCLKVLEIYYLPMVPIPEGRKHAPIQASLGML